MSEQGYEDLDRKRACQCCGYVAVSHVSPTCPVCYWESDPIQDVDPDYAGGANDISLREARANFARYRVSDPRFKDRVRDPLREEEPVP